MKKTSIILFCVGLGAIFFFTSSLYVSLTGDGLGGGYGAMYIGFPIVFVSIILFIISFFKKKNQ